MLLCNNLTYAQFKDAVDTLFGSRPHYDVVYTLTTENFFQAAAFAEDGICVLRFEDSGGKPSSFDADYPTAVQVGYIYF